MKYIRKFNESEIFLEEDIELLFCDLMDDGYDVKFHKNIYVSVGKADSITIKNTKGNFIPLEYLLKYSKIINEYLPNLNIDVHIARGKSTQLYAGTLTRNIKNLDVDYIEKKIFKEGYFITNLQFIIKL